MKNVQIFIKWSFLIIFLCFVVGPFLILVSGQATQDFVGWGWIIPAYAFWPLVILGVIWKRINNKIFEEKQKFRVRELTLDENIKLNVLTASFNRIKNTIIITGVLVIIPVHLHALRILFDLTSIDLLNTLFVANLIVLSAILAVLLVKISFIYKNKNALIELQFKS